jgi:hypothetical protein
MKWRIKASLKQAQFAHVRKDEGWGKRARYSLKK